MNIFVYTTFTTEEQHQLINVLPADVALTFKTDLQKSEISAALQAAEIILGNPPPKLFNENMPNLRFWQIDSSGFDQYKMLNIKVPVANMGALFAISCAETIIGGILGFYRQLHELIRKQALQQWVGEEIRTRLQTLNQKKVLILGAGTLGQAIKIILLGFGCQITTSARNNPKADLHHEDDIMNILPETDLVINTLPGTADQYVSKNFIDRMKTGAVYANVGRGNTTDETALIHALETGKLSGAILDVTAIEPIPEDHVLWKMENVILTQHTGGRNETEAEGRISQFLVNYKNFVSGKPLESLVELNQGY